MKTFRLLLALTLPALAVLTAHAQRERLPPEDLGIVEQRWPDAKKTSTGLRYVVLKEGDRPAGTPKPGDRVKVLYKGMLLDGTVFDETKDPEHAFTPRVGREQLIEAWEQALQRMHKGEKWVLIVPYELGYGTRGQPPKIPRRATLVFEMELLDFGASVPDPVTPPRS